MELHKTNTRASLPDQIDPANLKALEEELSHLHFQKARQLVSKMQLSNAALDWKLCDLQARLALNLGNLDEAFEMASKALSLSAGFQERQQSAARIIRILTLQGKTQEASALFEDNLQMNSNPSDDLPFAEADTPFISSAGYSSVSHSNDGWYLLAGAMLYYEMGAYEKAAALCRLILKPDFLKYGASGWMQLEAWSLIADIASCRQQSASALEAYRNAERFLDALPSNWRAIRQALLYNSCADACEAVENWQQAMNWHEKAEKAISSVCDREIYDLSGYQAEIWMADASCLSMADRPDKALAVLEERFVPLLSQMETSRDRLFWHCRYLYQKGLCLLYQGCGEQAYPLLANAADGFVQFALESKTRNLEYFARSAYYAASCAPDADSAWIFLHQALGVFRQIQHREPSFFAYSIADIHNQLGLLLQNLPEGLEEASSEYEQAIDGFYRLTLQQDLQSAQSLLAALLNRLQLPQAVSVRKQEEYAGKALDALNMLEEKDVTGSLQAFDPFSDPALLDRIASKAPEFCSILEKRRSAAQYAA